MIPALALYACTTLAAVLVGAFFVYAWPLVTLPADLLMFSETAFIENIIKLDTGRPLYTAPSDSNSIVYQPLAFLVSYAAAWALGLTRSVAGLRALQLGFTVAASIVATLTARQLQALAFPDDPRRHHRTWIAFTALSMLLVATAPHANQFTFALHVDAVGLLLSSLWFLALVVYARRPADPAALAALVVLPVLGFLTKQSLASWLAGSVVVVALRTRAPGRALAVALAGGALTVAAIYACAALWGDPYWFWTFTVLGARKGLALDPGAPSISLTRVADHLLRVWPELTVGLAGAWLMLRRRGQGAIVGPLLAAWALVVVAEAFASASGWGALYHFGPGVLMGATFAAAALPHIWYGEPHQEPEAAGLVWLRAALLAGAVLTTYMVWDVVPTGDPAAARFARKAGWPADVHRYIREVEREFEGLPAEKVLLAVGSWVYLKDGVLQRDRAVSLADQPPAGNYANFEVTNARIRARVYDKLLLQDFHSDYFTYDWRNWPRPSGFREAVLAHYDEVRTIEAAADSPYTMRDILMADRISVFVPKR